ncbi:30S ribosomal protein S16 [Candidatus Parcubacteria bacterium]|nr:30S ribosomal protein S16 [Candidatus Parcubacteria bacterium]
MLTEKKNAAKSGRFLEVLGSYNPHSRGKEITLKKERIEYWLSQGAKSSDTVHNLLVSQGVIKGPKIARKIKSKTIKKKEEASEVKNLDKL